MIRDDKHPKVSQLHHLERPNSQPTGFCNWQLLNKALIVPQSKTQHATVTAALHHVKFKFSFAIYPKLGAGG